MSAQLPITYENSVRVLEVSSPVYADATKTNINMMVRFAHLSEAVMFSASAKDSEVHSRALYEMASEGQFGEIAQPEEEPQIIIEARAKAQQEALLSQANSAIAWLQDAADLAMASEKENTALQEWKIYRVLLNRIDTSTAPDIDWPLAPQA